MPLVLIAKIRVAIETLFASPHKPAPRAAVTSLLIKRWRAALYSHAPRINKIEAIHATNSFCEDNPIG
jgi:hypothetical protein